MEIDDARLLPESDASHHRADGDVFGQSKAESLR